MATDTEQASTGGMAPATAWQPSSTPSPRKRRHRIRIVLFLLCVAAYAAGAFFFTSHFTPGTTIDGIDASLMTTSELEDALQQRADSYSQRVTGADGFEVTIAGNEVDLSFDCAAVAKEAQGRTNALLWLPYIVSPQHMLIDGNVQLNEDKLTDLLDKAITDYNKEAVYPTDAAAEYNEESKVFEIASEKGGTQLMTKPAVKASKTASRALNEEVTLDDGALIKPAVTKSDKTLNASVDKANAILESTPIKIDAGEDTIAEADRDTVASWMSFDDEQQLDISGVYEWVEGQESLSDAGSDKDEEHVWALDVQGTTDDIYRVLGDDLGEHAQVAREVIETKPAATEGARERGRHIDVNLDTQYARFYDSDGTVIWESYVVTGGWDTQFGEMHNTPTGEYAIEGKETNRTLIGADRDGDSQPDYESFVYYWMPFLAGDWGFHDATWRGEFGPGVREYWGSHGCINLPYDAAEQLYNLVNVGDAVYIHY